MVIMHAKYEDFIQKSLDKYSKQINKLSFYVYVTCERVHTNYFVFSILPIFSWCQFKLTSFFLYIATILLKFIYSGF